MHVLEAEAPRAREKAGSSQILVAYAEKPHATDENRKRGVEKYVRQEAELAKGSTRIKLEQMIMPTLNGRPSRHDCAGGSI